MERFVRSAADLSRGGAAGEDELLALAEAHGIEITRPLEEATRGPPGRPALRWAAPGTWPSPPAPGTSADSSPSTSTSTRTRRPHEGGDHGLILNAAARTDNGFMVLNMGPSKEGSESAARDPRRLGVIERAKINPDQIRREHHEVAHLVVFDS